MWSGEEIQPGEPLAELSAVDCTFPGPPDVQALRDCTLTVQRGEYVCITGKSGSGKSTLLNVLGLLTTPTCGTYRLAGISVTGLSDREHAAMRAQLLGFVFQSFHLLPALSVLANVQMGLRYMRLSQSEERARSIAMLDRVGLAHRAHAEPRTLSGGEQQRVAIARALVRSPVLLLCDEPTGNLDSQNAQSILEILASMRAEGLTIVTVTHDVSVAAEASRVIALHDGAIMTIVQ